MLGRPVVFRVRRAEGGDTALVFVPPAYTRDFGLVMKMGKVAAVREESPASKVKFADGDVISRRRPPT